MTRIDGSAARELDFGERPGRAAGAGLSGVRPMLRLTRLTRPARLSGPDKYKTLEAMRRQAQIRARRLLDLMDSREIDR